MENNKLLIGLQFTSAIPADKNILNSYHNHASNKPQNEHIELYIVRDLSLRQLLIGIRYGLKKLLHSAQTTQKNQNAARSPLTDQNTVSSDQNVERYQRWIDIFEACVKDCDPESAVTENPHGTERIYPRVKLTSYRNMSVASEGIGKQFVFHMKDLDQPVWELGFITSTRIIFDGFQDPAGMLKTQYLTEAFHPEYSDTVYFPEYNISTRQTFRFDTSPVKIIPPSDPPKKPRQNLFMMLIPALSTAVIMFLARMFLMQGTGGMRMATLSSVMCLSAVLSTAFAWFRQKREFSAETTRWRISYENYIKNLMREIQERQEDDTKKLNELYPDVFSLIREDKNGVYSMNRNLYSRAPQDEDFLTFRIGQSDQVESRFEIQGEEKDTVSSDAGFLLEHGKGKVSLFVYHKKADYTDSLTNLCHLPEYVAKEYQYLHGAPLLYSLRNSGALGVVDAGMSRNASRASGNQPTIAPQGRDQRKISHASGNHGASAPLNGAILPVSANYFMTRMVLELCYYHSPDNLQFVIFFPPEQDPDELERVIGPYKFMPHFRELFPDRSQFVFDDTSADLILSSLLTLMVDRQKAGSREPHIVLILYHEYALREHAFAQFLPQIPETGKPYENTLGLSFVCLSSHWEYLPPFCNNVVLFERDNMRIVPHELTLEKGFPSLVPGENPPGGKRFVYPNWEEARRKGEQKRDGGRILADYWIGKYNSTLPAYRFLSAIYYTRIAQNGKVPSMVSMYELIEAGNDTLEDVIRKKWGLAGGTPREADITKSMAVRIGKTESAFTFLDLHEKSDGPHMLVAGTTGSGKTETIITYLLSLCMEFRPDELNLLLVDMKGGGFTKRIGKLPHVTGAVTDVDGDENGTGAEYMLRRFLNAMKSEIQLRKMLLNRLRVDNIDAYINNCLHIDDYLRGLKENGQISPNEEDDIRQTAQNSPLSHIILVVDEFTELKRFSTENSDIDFMGEITTIARIGRSLGVHIILISQNIEGAITEDIRVNSNARLCLRVATRQASKEMIGTDVAASPSMPGHGRAYLLVGTGSKFVYFQSGYSMAGIAEEELPVEITLASKCGPYSSFYQSEEDNEKLRKEKKQRAKRGQTQLDVIVRAIQNVFQDSHEKIHTPRIVFSPPLPRQILLKDSTVFDLGRGEQPVELLPNTIEPSRTSGSPLEFAMGVYDAPDSPKPQKQPVLRLNLLNGNIAVFGGASSGKTTFLKTLLTRLHEPSGQAVPQEQIFIIDFGGFGGTLPLYADLPYVCSCFDNSNEENIKRVFRTVEKRLDENTALLNQLSAGNYKSAAESPSTCPPHLTLIIENLNAFLSDERYELYQEKLMHLCRDGQTKGLSVVVTSNDTAGTGRLMSHFAQKIAFEMPQDAYFDIFNRKVIPPMNVPGRGLVCVESKVYEFQCFLQYAPSHGKNASHKEDGSREESCLEALKASVSGVPEELRLKAFRGDLTVEMCPDVPDENRLCVGLDYYEHQPVCVDIQRNRAIAIYGKRKFGKTNLLNLLLHAIVRKHPQWRFVLLDDGRNELADDEAHLGAFYKTARDCVRKTDLDEFWDYLYENEYWSRKRGGTPVGNSGAEAEQREAEKKKRGRELSAIALGYGSPEPPRKNPPTVFVLQSRKLFQDGYNPRWLLNVWFQEAVGEAEQKNYIFIFSDLRPPSNHEVREILKLNLSAAFLLDNIGEFVMDKGNGSKSVFGEMDAKELKTEYARCSVGDGYYYDIEADDLTKLKLIRFCPKPPKGEMNA